MAQQVLMAQLDHDLGAAARVLAGRLGSLRHGSSEDSELLSGTK
jgi:hypothetical protein